MTDNYSQQSGEQLLKLAEVAELLRKSKSYVFKAWPKWTAHGVRPIRVGGTKQGRLLFRRTEIEQLLEQWQVT